MCGSSQLKWQSTAALSYITIITMAIISSLKFVFLQFASSLCLIPLTAQDTFIPFSLHSLKQWYHTQNTYIYIYIYMVEHCSANAEAMGSSPVEFPQIFFGFICNCSSCDHHCNDHIFIQNLYFGSSHHLHDLRATDSIANFTNNVRLSELCELQIDYLVLLFYKHVYTYDIFYNLTLFCVIRGISRRYQRLCATLLPGFK